MILTDANGRPIEKPQKPTNATIEGKIAYLQAVHAYNDKVGDVANAAFSAAFRIALHAQAVKSEILVGGKVT